jgi:hypothetical protein
MLASDYGTRGREEAFAGILPPLGDLIRTPGQEPAIWVADSPLAKVAFDN